MGLIDRDYMHERHRRRHAQRSSDDRAKWKIAGWTICSCAAIYLCVKYFVLPASGLPFPPQGQVLWYINPPGSLGATLTIKAPVRGSELHAVRINEAGTGRLIGLVPLRVGETLSLSVPLGAYEFVFASGRSWQGPEKLFGFTGKRTKTAEPLHFYKTGNQTIGHTIDLTQRVDGNLPTRPLAPFEK